ncbi:MAG: alpha-glucosidase/alpha-galactosidase [Roseiflexaceae bacterium]
MKNITLVGAGSASFGFSTLIDIFYYADLLQGSTITLNDVNAESLEHMLRLAERLVRETGAHLSFKASTDLRTAVAGTDFVVIAVARDRLTTWKQDWDIPLKYGVKHVLGENGGPGGLGHTLRSAHLVLEVAKVIEEVAPQALVLNFTNPLTRVCLALNRATKLRVVGLCHGIGNAYLAAGQVLGYIAGKEDQATMREVLGRRIDIKAAGLNHMTFVYELRDAETGADLYPEFLQRLPEMPPSFRPLARQITDSFGLFPSLGDGHMGEYISFAWETSALTGYDFNAAAQSAAELRTLITQAAAGEQSVSERLKHPSGERAIPIISAVIHGQNQYEVALNIPNRGSIPGLPEWAVVEVPGVVGPAGVYGLQVPALPPAITALLSQQVAIQDRAVEATIHGDRQAALQALLLDPTINSYQAATQILDELLTVHSAYLPQFAK